MNERALIQQMLDCIEELRYSDSTFTAQRKTIAAMEAASEYLKAPEQSELQDAKDTIELLEMRIDQLEAPEQSEPVAIFRADEDGGFVELIAYQGQPIEDGAKLYTAAPQPAELTEYNVRIAAEIEKLIDESDELRSELEAAKKDAQRYRWLRERLYKDGGDICFASVNAYDSYSGSLSGAFESAIDAAIEATK